MSDYINYILIAWAYGLGCYLSYCVGWNKGGFRAVDQVVNLISGHFKVPPNVVAGLLHKLACK